MLISSLRTTLRLESSLFSARWPLSSTPTTPLDGSIHRSFLERLLYIEKPYWHVGIGSHRSTNWMNCSLGTRLIVLVTSVWASQVLYSSSSHLIKPAGPHLLSLTRFAPSGTTPTGSPILLHLSDYTDQTTPPLLLLRHWRSLKALIHLHHRIALTQHSNNATRWQ